MGRAINMERDIDMLKIKVDTLEKAFNGLASTVEAKEKENISLDKPKTKKKKQVKEKV